MKDNSIHCVISDIPYGINFDDWDVMHQNTNSAFMKNQNHSTFKKRGKPLNGWCESDRSSNKQYQEWCSKWTNELIRIMIPGSSCLLICGRRTQHNVAAALEECGFVIRDVLIWVHKGHTKAQRLSKVIQKRKKSTIPDRDDSVLNGCRLGNLSPDYDSIIWAMKPYQGTITDNILKFGVGGFYVEEGQKVPSNIINNISSKISKNEKCHPTQKPVELLEYLIKRFCPPSNYTKQTILDPFCGSGTTCVAALKLGYETIGIELNETFATFAEKRCQKLFS